MLFFDRIEAGKLLANKMKSFKGKKNTLVLGLARGGVIVAYELAKTLLLPLNVVVPRKIGAPSNPELALGSVMDNGEVVFNTSIIKMLGVSQAYINQEIEKEKALAHQRLLLYRQKTPLPLIQNQTIILVDDGIATGSTMLASVQAIRAENAKKIIVAVPVASIEAIKMIEEKADEVVCLYAMEDFVSVGSYYRQFDQTDDGEVVKLLVEANQHDI